MTPQEAIIVINRLIGSEDDIEKLNMLDQLKQVFMELQVAS